MAVMIPRSKALLAAGKRMALKSDKAIMKHLDFAGMDALEAYKCGVEEAQSEIVNRIAAIPTRSATEKRPSNWFDGGYLENGHCSFMQAMNGKHYFCCRPHAHDGAHRVDSPSIKETK